MSRASGEDAKHSTSLRVVESFVERLRAAPPDDPSEALAVLVAELRATGACLLEWPRGKEPVMLCVSGLIQDVSQHPGFQQLVQRAGDGFAGVVSAYFEGSPGFWFALLPNSEAGPLGLLVWGELGEQSDCAALLRSLLGLLDRFLSRPRPPGASAKPGGLVFPEGYISGDSPALRELYRQMEPLLQGDLPVLIVGETGVGKEYVARMLHASSTRRSGPFVPINCAAIPAELLEAELFGVAKGAATGVSERPGRFQLAQGGTLFLDEIGEMSPELQAKLLRALQQKEIQPVGGGSLKVDLRVIAATNSDLRERMESGRFRSDLYYRVAGFVLRVPPLRERQGHIPRLVEDFIHAFARETGKQVRGVSVKALQALVRHHWPGNVRELEHEVRRLVYVCPDGRPIEHAMLSPHVVAGAARTPGSAAEAAGTLSLNLDERVSQLERELIAQALVRCGGNRTRAAKLLGVSRNGLAIKIERLGL
jgi:DNA-binding NtrC family response regulator